jgi:GAF domain-containing protein
VEAHPEAAAGVELLCVPVLEPSGDGVLGVLECTHRQSDAECPFSSEPEDGAEDGAAGIACGDAAAAMAVAEECGVSFHARRRPSARGPGWPFTPSDRELLQSMSAHAAVAFRNAHMLDDLVRAQTITAAVLDVAQTSAASFTPAGGAGGGGDGVSALVSKIIESTYTILDCERVSLFLVDHVKGELWLALSQDHSAVGTRIPVGQGLAGWVAAHGVPLTVPDAYADPRFDPSTDAATGFHTQSALVWPIALSVTREPPPLDPGAPHQPQPHQHQQGAHQHQQGAHWDQARPVSGMHPCASAPVLLADHAAAADCAAAAPACAVAAGAAAAGSGALNRHHNHCRHCHHHAASHPGGSLSAHSHSGHSGHRSHSGVHGFPAYETGSVLAVLQCINKRRHGLGSAGAAMVFQAGQTPPAASSGSAFPSPLGPTGPRKRRGSLFKAASMAPTTMARASASASAIAFGPFPGAPSVPRPLSTHAPTALAYARFTAADERVLGTFCAEVAIALKRKSVEAAFLKVIQDSGQAGAPLFGMPGMHADAAGALAAAAADEFNVSLLALFSDAGTSARLHTSVLLKKMSMETPSRGDRPSDAAPALADFAEKTATPTAAGSPGAAASDAGEVRLFVKSPVRAVGEQSDHSPAVVGTPGAGASSAASGSPAPAKQLVSSPNPRPELNLQVPTTPSTSKSPSNVRTLAPRSRSLESLIDRTRGGARRTDRGAASPTVTAGEGAVPGTPGPLPLVSTPSFLSPAGAALQSRVASRVSLLSDAASAETGTIPAEDALLTWGWSPFGNSPINGLAPCLPDPFASISRSLSTHFLSGELVAADSSNSGSSTNLEELHSAALCRSDSQGMLAADPAPGERRLQESVVAMFRHMTLLTRFQIDETKFASFVRRVRSKYHANPFHNWYHGVSVMHASFLIILTTSACEMLTFRDVLATLVAALGHDIDHPGNTNAFEINSGSELALMYSDDAVLERHHAHVLSTIIRQEGIFSHLSPDEQKALRVTIVKAILGTDMGKHFGTLADLAERGARYQEKVKKAIQSSFTASRGSFSLGNMGNNGFGGNSGSEVFAASELWRAGSNTRISAVASSTPLPSGSGAPSAGRQLPAALVRERSVISGKECSDSDSGSEDGSDNGSSSEGSDGEDAQVIKDGDLSEEDEDEDEEDVDLPARPVFQQRPPMLRSQTLGTQSWQSPSALSRMNTMYNLTAMPADATSPSPNHLAARIRGRRMSSGTPASFLPSGADLNVWPFDRDNEVERNELVSVIVHTADLSGQAYAIKVARNWTSRIIAEFKQQAVLEQERRLPVTPFMASLETPLQMARVQLSFIGNIVLPLWQRVSELLPGLQEPVQNLQSTKMLYEGELAKHEKNETKDSGKQAAATAPAASQTALATKP